jgi:hypothetical protein
MNTIQLKHKLIQRISRIEDPDFLSAIMTILNFKKMARRKYKYEFKETNSYPIVEVKDVMNQPEYLCKYYSINERNVSAVIARKIFVSTPDLLNDLFDSLYLNIKADTSQIDQYSDFANAFKDTFDEVRFKESEEYREEFRINLFYYWNANTGILSMTEESTNDLMWAHYTDNEGFLLQFDYELFPDNFGKPVPISYLEPYEFSEYQVSNLFHELYVNSLLKKNIWVYENEYRFIVLPKNDQPFLTSGRFSNEAFDEHLKESRLQTYPKESVKKIILGFNFFKKIISDENKINFGKPGGLLKKTLYDFAHKENIDMQMLKMDTKKMVFTPVDFELKPIIGLEYEIIWKD